MKIIVTGGAGFIASHIVDKYISLGHKVIVIDDLSTGFKKNVNKKAKFYKADIRNLQVIEKIFKKEKPNIVNHHAAIAEVVKSLKNPVPTMEVNILGTVNILINFSKYNASKGRKKFIFSSSGATYGGPKKIPADENTPIAPLSPYGLSKYLGEICIQFYAKTYGFDYLIFRYANIYGERQNPKGEAGVISIFTGLIKENKQPTIFGDGTKSRDYIYIQDTARANVLGLKNGRNEIINLGSGKKTTDQMIFDEVAENFNFKEKPIYAPYRKGEVYQIALSAKKAKKILGWAPKIPLKQGIKKTVETIK
ncbi:MAG: NAD-dependent epimerase/dehydratase family protein [Candidatus Shapirobacteria bacterium]